MWIESLNVALDANQDGTVSLLEAWGIAKQIYLLPGNLLLEAVGQFPQLAAMFNIKASSQSGYSSLNGWFSNSFSLLFWLYVIIQVDEHRHGLFQRRNSVRSPRKTNHGTPAYIRSHRMAHMRYQPLRGRTHQPDTRHRHHRPWNH